MQSFQRVVALLSMVIVSGFLLGCGGPGTPVPGGSDPVSESADAALAPEGGPVDEEESSEETPPAEATESTPESAATPEASE